MKYLAIGLLLIASQVSFAGPRVVKNGGDLDAIEFVGIGQQLVKSLREHQDLVKVDLGKLSKAVDETTVESTTQTLILDGATKDAINTPSAKAILFNRTAWAGKGDLTDKAILVLHEYFGIAGIADQKYNVSTNAITKIGFGKITYRGEVYDGQLNQEEIKKLLPMYLNMISAQAKTVPSTSDNYHLRMMTVITEGVVLPSTIQDKIRSLDRYLQELKEVTEQERVADTMLIVDGFNSGKGKVSCEVGYRSIARMERIVKCVDTQSRSPQNEEHEGFTEERTIILDVDSKTFEPKSVRFVNLFAAG